MLSFDYTRQTKKKQDLKIGSSKTTIKVETKPSSKKSNHICIQIPLSLLLLVERIIDYLEPILATTLF